MKIWRVALGCSWVVLGLCLRGRSIWPFGCRASDETVRASPLQALVFRKARGQVLLTTDVHLSDLILNVE